MQLLLIMHFLPYPPDSGAARRNLGFVREAARRHTVDVVAFVQRKTHPRGPAREAAIAALRQECNSLQVVEVEADRSPWHSASTLLRGVFSSQPFSSWRFRSSEMSRVLAQRFAEVRYDLIQVDTIALMPVLRLPKGIPVALVHHNAESDLMRKRVGVESGVLRKAYCWSEARRLRRLEARAMTSVAINIAVSEVDRQRLLEHVPRARVEVLPNGTSLKAPAAERDAARPTVLFAGPMTWLPNRDAAMFLCDEIFPLVLEEEPDALLRIVGAQPPDALMRAAARHPSVNVVGYVDDYARELASAQVFVAPFRLGGGTRLKILDAFAASKALVSTSIGCEGLEVADGRELLIADQPGAFATAIVRLLREQTLRTKLVEGAREFVRTRHDWAVLGNEQERLMRMSVDRHTEGALGTS